MTFGGVFNLYICSVTFSGFHPRTNPETLDLGQTKAVKGFSNPKVGQGGVLTPSVTNPSSVGCQLGAEKYFWFRFCKGLQYMVSGTGVSISHPLRMRTTRVARVARGGGGRLQTMRPLMGYLGIVAGCASALHYWCTAPLPCHMCIAHIWRAYWHAGFGFTPWGILRIPPPCPWAILVPFPAVRKDPPSKARAPILCRNRFGRDHSRPLA